MIHESEKFFFSAFVLPQKSINLRNFLSAGRYRDRERERERLVKRTKDIICKERDRVGEGERDRERYRERKREIEKEEERGERGRERERETQRERGREEHKEDINENT